jgi:hypothetical protein
VSNPNAGFGPIKPPPYDNEPVSFEKSVLKNARDKAMARRKPIPAPKRMKIEDVPSPPPKRR